jgi:hypothetical protein
MPRTRDTGYISAYPVIVGYAPALSTIEYLVVAGGGTGGAGRGGIGGGGGGGAGGFVTGSIPLEISVNYGVTIGAGGAAHASGTLGSNGSNSVI